MNEKMDYRLESMSEAHRKPVIDIFNYYIEHSFSAYPEAAVEYDFFDRFFETSKGYPALVVRSAEGEVVGFAFMRLFHPISSFKRTAEITYFILPAHGRKGLGKAILDRFIEEARNRGMENLLASISSLNGESLEFHLKNGFTECGRFKDVGKKFGENYDLVWMQKHL